MDLGSQTDSVSPNDLYIEVLLSFPELHQDHEHSYAIPPVFDQMIVDRPGGDPYCRLRLEATWTDDGTADGFVDQNIYWVLMPQASDQAQTEARKIPLTPQNRAHIQVNYIPATRDPAPEFRNAARGRIGRIMRAISWQESTRQSVTAVAERISDTLSAEGPVALLSRVISNRWDQVRSGEATAIDFEFAGASFDNIIHDFSVVFNPNLTSEKTNFSSLSEGQRSLFYLALVAAIFDIERELSTHQTTSTTPNNKANAADTISSQFNTQKLSIPALTVFAIEEPENHLAPHYLAKIIALLRSLNLTGRSQTIFSSHSSSVLRRVQPDEVRHIQLTGTNRTSIVKELTLPPRTDEASKYVREAVTSYPELYFAKFAILAEGPSEELAIPRIAAANGLDIDKSFVSVIPLGGRHVNHFWKLLRDLQIPHATLLDLDFGRSMGGWHRIKYVCQQLLATGTEPSNLLQFSYRSHTYDVTNEDLDSLHTKRLDEFNDLKAWLSHLQTFGVFFCSPLDFDFEMLRRFPSVYQDTCDGHGPSFPATTSAAYDEYILDAIEVAVSSDEAAADLYLTKVTAARELLPWYRYLFLARSKPSTHFRALLSTSDEDIRKNTPPPIARLLDRCQQALDA